MKPTSTDNVIELMEAYLTSAALNTALELGLFGLLAEQPLDAAGVAQALGIPQNRCGHWLALLRRTGLLERSGRGYALSSTAQTAILDAYSQEAWAFLAREARYRYPAILDLALHIRQPGSVWEAQGLAPPDYFAQLQNSLEEARKFTRMLYEIHLPLADELARMLDMQGVDRLLDLGGGSGVVSLALLRRHPGLSATIVDIANVCAAGREIAAENGMEERIVYHALDFSRKELPAGFDMVMACDVGPFDVDMYRKIRAALKPGGRLVTVDRLAPTEGVAPPTWAYWAFLASLENPDFTRLTRAEFQGRLEQAGFQILSERTTRPSEALRWSGGWTVFEARQ
jgi:ubiquinone/menaquinone biosynthesis C-methylase UbiE